jgi:hypothetical protein
MNIFFDVDHTIIDNDDRLRPGVRELFVRLRAGGHRIFLWSGIGVRSEVVARHALDALVDDCFVKPLYAHERMLEPLGIHVWPEYVVDDHPHLVHIFGGCVVQRYLNADERDTEMERVYQDIEHATALASRARMGDER